MVFGKMGMSGAPALLIEFVAALVISEGIFVLTLPFFPFLFGESRRFGFDADRGVSRYR
jgi:hypothetical protein